jgi:hypothetical protein
VQRVNLHVRPRFRNVARIRTPHADLAEVTGMVWSMLLAGVTECDQDRLGARRGSQSFLVRSSDVSKLPPGAGAYTYRGWCGGGAFRRVSPRPSKSEIVHRRRT